MIANILIAQTPEGDYMTQFGESCEPFFSVATKAMTSGKIGKQVVKEVAIVRVSGNNAQLLKQLRCEAPKK
jgi:hypothetical protein